MSSQIAKPMLLRMVILAEDQITSLFIVMAEQVEQCNHTA